jgi:hypothetical protein
MKSLGNEKYLWYHLYKTQSTGDRRTDVNPDLGTDCKRLRLGCLMRGIDSVSQKIRISTREPCEVSLVAVKDLDHRRSPITTPFVRRISTHCCAGLFVKLLSAMDVL